MCRVALVFPSYRCFVTVVLKTVLRPLLRERERERGERVSVRVGGREVHVHVKRERVEGEKEAILASSTIEWATHQHSVSYLPNNCLHLFLLS